ncbi:hypothetical protein BCR32DRAFT_245810 [Anaeromyces robustus]|uniref:N-acetyltransferase ECO1 n=1 Tax=Anaeromyces robustus TaxID=1754192 RepID=A0A1Y1X3A1_9FUNG|nr:hypothetical protein BCR32DRAFT_245810 [Anaeromyces robustus]|eukprot:ORX80172.1 hypothetical protein BCR32DRAFT_245810 [Anaeromyces robustus]
MTAKNIKFTYKRKGNTIQNLNTKRIRILNEVGNELVQDYMNEDGNNNLKKGKKHNLNDISTYFSKRISKQNKESLEIEKSSQIFKSCKTIESYFKSKENKGDFKTQNLVKESENRGITNEDSLNNKKILQKKTYEQLYINFGQKMISPIICPDCGVPYNPSIQEDDIQHQKYHNIIIDGIEYNGYKTDKIIQYISKDIYISEAVISETTSSHKKKLLQILNLIETELGAVRLQEKIILNYKFFLYIKNKKLIGCAIVRDVKEGLKIELDKNIEQITTIENIKQRWLLKIEVTKVPILCGISRIWVSKKERQKGVASQLLDSIRKHFLFNMILERNQIAFSQPTKLGTKLAYHFFNYTNDEEEIIIIPSKKYIIIYMDDN